MASPAELLRLCQLAAAWPWGPPGPPLPSPVASRRWHHSITDSSTQPLGEPGKSWPLCPASSGFPEGLQGWKGLPELGLVLGVLGSLVCGMETAVPSPRAGAGRTLAMGALQGHLHPGVARSQEAEPG